MNEPKDRVAEKSHIKPALCRNSYTSWLLEQADKPPLDQSIEEGVEENPPNPALDRAGPSAHTETTTVEPPDLDKTKKIYPVEWYVKDESEQVRRVIKDMG